MSVILKAENISKQYRLGLVGSSTIKDDMLRLWASARGKEDPFLKIGDTNDRSVKGTGDYVWALKDINFEVQQGEVLGIIGKNGAGKSTLLKLLSRVTAPTTGTIKTRGRIASLLEVGTGFHPELTGRENIYLNGAILGMTKPEITSKLDEIIDFSGCERYIDTPTKRYSSGMTVRLAFAVAAHLEPEILVVDEVLAVGDAEFQKKAIGKMQDISKGEGRTVLFVSHDMASIQKLCGRVILLENGSVKSIGTCAEIIDEYIKINHSISTIFTNNINPDKVNQVNKVEILTSNGTYFHDQLKDLKILVTLKINQPIEDAALSYQILDVFDRPIIHELLLNEEMNFGQKSGICKIQSTVGNLGLYPGTYSLNVYFADNSTKTTYSRLIKTCGFEIVKTEKRNFYWELGSAVYKELNTKWIIHQD